MKLSATLACLVIITSCANNLNTNAAVENEALEQHVSILSHDDFEGRGAGYIGERKAALYIADNFKKVGLDAISENSTNVSINDYFQPFSYNSINPRVPWEVLKTQNVVGVLVSKTNPDEYIVVGGHHDGQGKEGQAELGRDIVEDENLQGDNNSEDKIWNSAVDNAVSIASIIEIANALNSSQVKLNRSIIFVTFSAEEPGLHGSVYFVNNPPVPLNRIKAMVNLEKLVGDPAAELLYVSYDSNEVFETVRKNLEPQHPLKLNPFYPGVIANTDHYPFALKRIPTVTIGTGSAINIHTPFDHNVGLNYQQLRQRTEYILSFIENLANSDISDDFNLNLSHDFGVIGGLASRAEMDSRGFGGDVAFKVTSIITGSKGDNLGLNIDDLIVAVNSAKIPRKSYYLGLNDLLDTETASQQITVIRGPEKQSLTFNIN